MPPQRQPPQPRPRPSPSIPSICPTRRKSKSASKLLKRTTTSTPSSTSPAPPPLALIRPLAQPASLGSTDPRPSQSSGLLTQLAPNIPGQRLALGSRSSARGWWPLERPNSSRLDERGLGAPIALRAPGLRTSPGETLWRTRYSVDGALVQAPAISFFSSLISNSKSPGLDIWTLTFVIHFAFFVLLNCCHA